MGTALSLIARHDDGPNVPPIDNGDPVVNRSSKSKVRLAGPMSLLQPLKYAAVSKYRQSFEATLRRTLLVMIGIGFGAGLGTVGLGVGWSVGAGVGSMHSHLIGGTRSRHVLPCSPCSEWQNIVVRLQDEFLDLLVLLDANVLPIPAGSRVNVVPGLWMKRSSTAPTIRA